MLFYNMVMHKTIHTVCRHFYSFSHLWLLYCRARYGTKHLTPVLMLNNELEQRRQTHRGCWGASAVTDDAAVVSPAGWCSSDFSVDEQRTTTGARQRHLRRRHSTKLFDRPSASAPNYCPLSDETTWTSDSAGTVTGTTTSRSDDCDCRRRHRRRRFAWLPT